MKVKIKKLILEAVIPSYAKEGDAGMDLVATSKEGSTKYGFMEYGTGLAVEIPEGYVGYVFPRSSISKNAFNLCNSVGVIDSGYRGEIKCRFNLATPWHINAREDRKIFSIEQYEVGDRIAQLIIMPIPTIEFEEVEELSETERGEGGFGSSGV